MAKKNLEEDLTEGDEIILEKDLTEEEEIILEKDLIEEEGIILEESQPTKKAVDEVTRIRLLINMEIRAIGTVIGNHLLKDSSA